MTRDEIERKDFFCKERSCTEPSSVEGSKIIPRFPARREAHCRCLYVADLPEFVT